MCFSHCQHENFEGDCKAVSIDGFRPCDDGYEEAKGRDEYHREQRDEARAEQRRGE